MLGSLWPAMVGEHEHPKNPVVRMRNLVAWCLCGSGMVAMRSAFQTLFVCSGLAEFSKTGEFSHVFRKLLVFIKLSRAKLILLSLLEQRSGCHFTTKQHNCLWGLHQDRSAERRPSFGGFGFVCGEMWFWTTSLVESESCNAVSLRQAAANLSFRLGGWLHLWKGFIGEEGWDMLVILSCFDASDQDRLLSHRVIKSLQCNWNGKSVGSLTEELSWLRWHAFGEFFGPVQGAISFARGQT